MKISKCFKTNHQPNFNIEIEIIGNWIYCFEAMDIKTVLELPGFKWAVKKQTWHNAPIEKIMGEKYPLKNKERQSMVGGLKTGDVSFELVVK